MGCCECKIFRNFPLFQSIDEKKSNHEQHEINISIDDSLCRIENDSHRLKSVKIDYPDSANLDTLPVELIYHIFDRLDTFTILTSLHNVCRRLNSIIQNYNNYDLRLISISMTYFYCVSSVLRAEQIVSMSLSDGSDNVGLVKLFLRKFQLEKFQRLRQLTLINVTDKQQTMRILLSIPDQLKHLTIDNKQNVQDDTISDVLLTVISRYNLETLTINVEQNEFHDRSFLWSAGCSLREIHLIGNCHLTLFRNILLCSSNLEVFQAHDIDFDDEWIDVNLSVDDDDDNDERQIMPITNADRLKSISLIYARNSMDRIEWFLRQFTSLKYLKYLNVYDFHATTDTDDDDQMLDGSRWEKLVSTCDKFEFIFTSNQIDNVRSILTSFQTSFWHDKNWPIALEQYDNVLLIYSIPYAHHCHYFDRPVFSSIPHDRYILSQSMANVTKLRIKINALSIIDKQIIGPPRFPNASHLILDGNWNNSTSIDSLKGLVSFEKIVKFIRSQQVPPVLFQQFLSLLINLQALSITQQVVDCLETSNFQHLTYLKSLNILQLEDDSVHVKVESLSRMFPRVEHLSIPVNSIESCQFIMNRLSIYLSSVIFRFPSANGNENEEPSYTILLQWAKFVQRKHQYRISERDVCIWMEPKRKTVF